MSADKRGPMPIEERAKRFLASYSKHGGKARAKSYRQVGEMEQCQIAQNVLGETLKPDPHKAGVYYLTCPGISFHTGRNSRRDCYFYPGGVSQASRGGSAPSLNCCHQSCGTVIEEMNRKIRSEIGKAGVEYLTDHGSVLNNAAASLIIGFDMKDADALKLLVEWGKTCTPIHTAAACGSAIAAALAAYKKKPEEVGYLLKKPARAVGSGSSSPSPSKGRKASFVSAPSPSAVLPAGEPIYIGVKGKVAKYARSVITAYQEDNGIDPTVLLLGPEQPEVGPKLCGLRVERMKCPGISVCRDTMDACDG